MKKMKKIALSILGVAFIATGFVACSSDDSGNKIESVNETEQNSIKSTSSVDYARYAKDFYKKDFTEGRTIDIDSGEGDLIQIKELVVDGEARGYVVSDLNNGDFLYFADVDRNNDILTIFDSKESKTSSFNNLRTSNDYLVTEKFDFIKYSNDYVTVASKKYCGFWKKVWCNCTKKVERPVYGADGEVTGCITYWTKTSYFLGMVADVDYDISGIHPCS